MQITVQVSETIRREAEMQCIPVVDFYALLIDRGLESVCGREEPNAILARICALRPKGETTPEPFGH